MDKPIFPNFRSQLIYIPGPNGMTVNFYFNPMTRRTHYKDGELIRTLRWSNPDGTLYSDDELNALMQSAVKIENYEQAAKIRDELKRRKEGK